MTPNAWLSGDVHQSELVKFPASESHCVLWGCSWSSNALEVIVVFGPMATKPLVLRAMEDRLRAERSFSVIKILTVKTDNGKQQKLSSPSTSPHSETGRAPMGTMTEASSECNQERRQAYSPWSQLPCEHAAPRKAELAISPGSRHMNLQHSLGSLRYCWQPWGRSHRAATHISGSPL